MLSDKYKKYDSICPSLRWPVFRKIMKKWCQNVKNVVKIMSDTSKCHQHSVAYMKMSSKWCRIHGSSRPRKPPVAIIHIFVRIFEVQLGGHGAQRSERLSDKTENHHPNKLYLNRSDDEKVRCFINKSLCLYSELWFLCRRGAHFYKKGEKR